MKNRVIGIDLGTTNCALSLGEQGKIRSFPIEQKVREGETEERLLLPSCFYLAPEEQDDCVGVWAMEQGLRTPTRLIQSAKSWLAHPTACLRERILPLDAVDTARRLSAVEVTTRLLDHLRDVYNQKRGHSVEQTLQEQEVVLTIPASFDEAARMLTLEAARAAGLQHVTLLEEPLAAMYAWLYQHPHRHLEIGQTILVCDVGGGTTDFSLLHIEPTGLRRTAVGRHLLLGGDNIDLALAHHWQHMYQKELTTAQWLALLLQIRQAKEILLEGKQESYPLWLAGTGSSLIGGGHQGELQAQVVKDLVLEGFFGCYSWGEAQQLKKGSGVRQMGLPYEPEPSITKHLAAFLAQSGEAKKPRYVLFNGGMMKPAILQKRILDHLQRWFPDAQTPIEVLKTTSLDMAVSLGAAAFGLSETKIASGLPRIFYLGVEVGKEEKALTLLTRGAEPGAIYCPEHMFTLRTNAPVQFTLYHSHTRLHDRPGDVIAVDPIELSRLPPIQSQLTFGKQTQLEVRLQAQLTPIGTLALSLAAPEQGKYWDLEFGLQQEKGVRTEDLLEREHVEHIQHCVQDAFATGSSLQLIPYLEKVLEKSRKEWSCSLLRAICDPILKLSEKRLLSPQYASRFWNTVGYCLRPGVGHPLDSYRIKEVWKLVLQDWPHHPPHEVMLQQWICFRRLAAGLSKGQQTQIFHRILPTKTQDAYAYAEKIRVLAALERVDTQAKVKLAEALLQRLEEGKGLPVDYWALARLGARRLLYGSLADVISKKICEAWVERLLLVRPWDAKQGDFLLATLIHPIAQRTLDISEELTQRVLQRIGHVELAWDHPHQERLFGDTLPAGLVMQQDLVSCTS